MPETFSIPGAPAALMDIINARRARIPAGLMMMADDQAPADGQVTEQQKPDEGDPPLGPNGESALRKERERADELDKQVKALSGQFSKLAQALGVDAKSSKDADLADAVGDLTKRLDVSELARDHGITDKDDIATLLAVSDPATRAKLAARLAPAKGAQGDEKGDEVEPKADTKATWPRPKPDATQGPKGEQPAPDPGKGIPRLTAAYAASESSSRK